MVKLLEVCRKVDLDGDGIPDVRGHNQDYDQWMMFGLGTYTASHWPVALRAMAQMGRTVGDDRMSVTWEAEAVQAAQRIDEDLWTGKWYALYYDRKKNTRSQALLVNNLLGEWVARMTGLTPGLPVDRIRQNLRSVFELNRQPGTGLRCGWFPPDEHRPIGTRDWHWNTCWLGSEYAVASHLIHEGLVDEGMTVAKEGHQRHDHQSLRYNHFECGEHYTRALTVWTVLFALQGLRWNAPTKTLAFHAKVYPENHRSVFVLPGSWGIFEQQATPKGGKVKISLRQGTLSVRKLQIPWTTGTAWLNGKLVSHHVDNGTLCFDQEVNLSAGGCLEFVDGNS